MAASNKKERAKDLSTPNWHAKAKEVQKYGEVEKDLPHPLSPKVRGAMVDKLNQLLADSMTIRDLYKKHHWQVGGPTFYQLHLLFDKHFDEQVEIVDTIAMAPDVAELTSIPRPPRGKEEVPVQISRLLEAHKILIAQCLKLSEAADKAGDQGTNDLAVSDVLRPNELQAWFIGQHLVQM